MRAAWKGIAWTLVTVGLSTLPGAASPSAWRASQPTAEMVDAAALFGLWADEQIEHRGIPGLVVGVVHDDRLFWAEGYGTEDVEEPSPVSLHSRFRLGSITKLLTSTAVLQLRDAGKLRLDDPVSRHLPWFSIGPAVNDPVEDAPEITVEQLLTHTAGLPREAPYPYWTDHEFPSSAQLRETVPGQRLIYPPGTRYKYSNLGMALLGAIVEAASGMSYSEYMESRLFEPLSMGSTSVAPGEKELAALVTGYSRRADDGSRTVLDYYETRALAPAANAVSTVDDLARFAALQFQDGPAGGSQILRGATLREMHRPHWVYPSWSGGRGLGFSVSQRNGKTVVSHGGWVAGHRCHLLLVPEEKIAVIAMTNADDGSPSFFAYRAYDTVAQVIRDGLAPKAAKPSPPDPAWRAYVGRYTDPWNWEYRVLLREDGLWFYEHSYPPDEEPEGSLTRLVPVSEHTFRLPDGELVVFELGGDGQVERIKRRYDYLFPLGAPFDVPVSAADGRDE